MIKVSMLQVLLLISITGFAQNKNGTPSPQDKLDGHWLITLNSKDIGAVNTMLQFESQKNDFEAWSRRNADRDILGFWKSSLARIFTKSFEKGSLLHVRNGTVTYRGDTLILAGIFRSAMGSYYFNGEVTGNQLSARLTTGKRQIAGTITGKKDELIKVPLEDYPAIIDEALTTAKNKIYNRQVLQTSEWRKFEKTIMRNSKNMQDDVELVFAYFYHASKLPFSHFALTRKAEITENSGSPADTRSGFLSLEEKNQNTALLTIESFGGTAFEVDSIFNLITKKGYSNLIVDLRKNSGGSVEAGMAFGRRVVDTTVTAGFFVTQNWFNINPSLPTKEQLKDFPVFTAANYDLIIEGIHRERGMVLQVEPGKEIYKGRLFILTSGITASTCEPIVYTLKTEGRATIVGTKTAGSMLNGEPFQLNKGFSLFVPTADYYTIDGYRIDHQGVAPNIVLKNEDPVKYTVEQLIR